MAWRAVSGIQGVAQRFGGATRGVVGRAVADAPARATSTLGVLGTRQQRGRQWKSQPPLWYLGTAAGGCGAVWAAMETSRQSRAACAAAPGAKVRMALCQIGVTADKPRNIQHAKAALKKAAAGGAQMISLPECWNSPYAVDCFPVYAEPVPAVGGTADPKVSPSAAMVIQAAKEHGVFIVGGSIPEVEVQKDGKKNVYNTSITVDPKGQVVAKHRKMHLFDIDVPGKITFRESDTLTAGDQCTYFDTPFGRVGVAICYDIRFPELSAQMRRVGCDILVFPGAFNMTTGPAHWTLLQRARAVDEQVFVVTVSPARSPDPKDYQAWGHSSVISPWGDVLVEADSGDEIVFCDMDLDKIADFRSSIPTEQQKRNDLYKLNWKSKV